MGINIGAVIDEHFPLARTCAHTTTKESLERELADDRYYDIVVTRCANCNLPMGDHYAEPEEVERLRNETTKR